ncbi:MAG: MarR family transcriptional regulator, partial [Pseudomonadota bacterium]
HATPGLSQSEVADILEIEKATAGRLIDKMEAKGWLERRSDSMDRRVNRLHLTTEAERLHELIFPVALGTVDDALAGLSDSDRATLGRLMNNVKAELLGLLATDTAPKFTAEPVPADA